MQKIKKFLLILTAILFANSAIAQGPPVPMGPAKLPAKESQPQQVQKIQTQQTAAQQQQKDASPKASPEQNTEQSVQKTVEKQENKIKNEVSAKKSEQEKAKSKKAEPQKTVSDKFKHKKHPKPVRQNTPKEPKIQKGTPQPATSAPQKSKKQENKTKANSKNNAAPDAAVKQEITPPNEQAQTQSTIKPSQLNDIREQAKFLYNSNKLAEAEELFNQIPDSEKISDDWLFLANIAQDNERPIDAVFLLKKAIAADDNNYKAHYNLGNLYFYDNKINMAMSEYKKVLKLKKDFAYAYYNKGCCYLKKGSWFNARYEFGLAIKANPNEPAFYYNLAYTYKKMKKDKKAKEALEMYNKLMTQ